MTYTLPVSKRGTLTLPPELRRRLKLDQVASPLVIVEERDGGLFLQSAVAMPILLPVVLIVLVIAALLGS
jgi:bifunctional DNA-binding transcriptional regulator/antitoxin component of YhaV-PrlF toxin-antitoxin module